MARRDVMAAPEVCRRTGATYRQLDYWTRTGLLGNVDPTPGSGFPRHYTDADVVLVAVIVRLRQAGVEGRAIGQAIRGGRLLAFVRDLERAVNAAAREVA